MIGMSQETQVPQRAFTFVEIRFLVEIWYEHNDSQTFLRLGDPTFICSEFVTSWSLYDQVECWALAGDWP